MTRISSKKLDPKTESQLFTQLTLLFTTADGKQVGQLFDALFTDSEKVMFIKRLATVFLIAEGYSTYAIAKRLKVSDSTVRNIITQAKAGKFDPLLAVTRKRSFDKDRFIEIIEVLMRGGLPPMGKDRWRWLDKHVKEG